jgi:Zn-finger nucleic acid-binding protein
MSKCCSCSAPLPANTQYCRYCGVRNDIDLQGKHSFQLMDGATERICPECRQSLQTIALNADVPLHIERCASCFGLFFDPGEIELLLDSALAPVATVNLELLSNINQDRYSKEEIVKYLKCPVCQTLMNRVVYGYRSGVVIDQCKSHGIWLDAGQISHLLEWKKAGGQLLNQQKMAVKQRQSKQESIKKNYRSESMAKNYSSYDAEEKLLETVSRVIYKIFE